MKNNKGPFNLFLALCLLSGILSGCSKKDEFNQAQEFAARSEAYYKRAADIYKNLIAEGKDLERTHFELGQLYYNQGEFSRAIAEFKKSDFPQSKKLSAISYYRLGDFTDALGIFNSENLPDDEYLYYHGLTCEKLNLFDQAIGIYNNIKTGEFSVAASERLEIILRESGSLNIKNISSQTHQILESSPSQEEYPQAGALILFCDEKIEVTPQNTQVSTLHYVIRILNERGKEDFAETHIDYDSTYERVELEYARTIKPDGSVAQVGTRHIRDVSRYLNFPLYSNARVYIISFPEITEGSAIEYKVKVYRSQLINKKDFIVTYPLQSQEPVMAANLSISVPQDRNLRIKTVNNKYNDFKVNFEPEKESRDGYSIYKWQFRNIPQIIPESNMPRQVVINPTMLVSTFSSWRQVYDWWWELAKDKLKADAAIKDKVRELTEGKVSSEDKIKAIYNFCAQKIRYVGVEYGQAGYEPHQAADIYRNKYGDCKDKAVLLVTMLKEAGFKAWPLLIPTKECYDLNKDFPSMLFDHSIAAVQIDEKVIFMDPTAQTCAFGDLPSGDQGRNVLIFKEDGYAVKETPVFAPQHNRIRQYIKIKVNGDETVSAERKVLGSGMYDQSQRYWMLFSPPELIRESLKEKIQSISIGAVLDGYEIKNLHDLNAPVELSYSFHGPEYFTAAGKTRIAPQLALLDTSLVAKDKRKYPIEFPVLDSKEIFCEIEIPGSFDVEYLPPNVTEDSPWMRFSVEYFQKGNKIYFTQVMEIKKDKIPEDEYASFKDSFESLARKVKQRMILRAKR
ncbi:MAG: DUF3857 domain-containing protein [Candidatus Omnitrophica bacterium]|nr:DUF3857 domain-containing protein [Candidatus Omnitrophota bacterium]MDD5552430.1 DUF3857 domain-containing protein [Candidatus Omnitrophota bacterium]